MVCSALRDSSLSVANASAAGSAFTPADTPGPEIAAATSTLASSRHPDLRLERLVGKTTPFTET
ncbi:hypothetical protein MTY414_71030 [Mycolicibacterium mageritense]|nr:hypothetical protein MTY414_71030 [Mycolicibacterium mageritense]